MSDIKDLNTASREQNIKCLSDACDFIQCLFKWSKLDDDNCFSVFGSICHYILFTSKEEKNRYSFQSIADFVSIHPKTGTIDIVCDLNFKSQLKIMGWTYRNCAGDVKSNGDVYTDLYENTENDEIKRVQVRQFSFEQLTNEHLVLDVNTLFYSSSNGMPTGFFAPFDEKGTKIGNHTLTRYFTSEQEYPTATIDDQEVQIRERTKVVVEQIEKCHARLLQKFDFMKLLKRNESFHMYQVKQAFDLIENSLNNNCKISV